MRTEKAAHQGTDGHHADERLVEQTLAGDHEAFAALLDRHRAVAARLAGRLLGDQDEAEDVLQEAALTAYLNLRALRSPERFRGWFCGIALNCSRTLLRRRRRAPATGQLDDAAQAADDVEAVAAERELLTQVAEAVRELPQAQQEAALLVYVEGLTTQEAGDVLGVSPGALKVRLHRARLALRARFTPTPSRRTDPKRRRRLNMVELDVLDAVSTSQPTTGGREFRFPFVLLGEKGGARVLPIFIGEAEAEYLAVALRGEETARPLSYDLTANLLEAVGATVRAVTVAKLVDETFFATVSIQSGGISAEVDARPSDAINLALRTGAPVFAEEKVMEDAALTAQSGKLERSGAAAILERVRERWEAGKTIPPGGGRVTRDALRSLGFEFPEDEEQRR